MRLGCNFGRIVWIGYTACSCINLHTAEYGVLIHADFLSPDNYALVAVEYICCLSACKLLCSPACDIWNCTVIYTDSRTRENVAVKIAVGDIFIVKSAHAAELALCAYRACAVAVFDCAVVFAADAADTGVSVYRAYAVAVCDSAIVWTGYTADIFITVKVWIYNSYVFNRAGVAYWSEQSDTGCFRIINVQAGYCVSLSVEFTFKYIAFLTDRSPYSEAACIIGKSAVSLKYSFVHCNIGGEDSFYAWIISAVYLLCKPVKVGNAVNLINAVFIGFCRNVRAAEGASIAAVDEFMLFFTDIIRIVRISNTACCCVNLHTAEYGELIHADFLSPGNSTLVAVYV